MLAHPPQPGDAFAQPQVDAVRSFHSALVDDGRIGTAAPRADVVGACELRFHVTAQCEVSADPASQLCKPRARGVEPVKVAVEYDSHRRSLRASELLDGVEGGEVTVESPCDVERLGAKVFAPREARRTIPVVGRTEASRIVHRASAGVAARCQASGSRKPAVQITSPYAFVPSSRAYLPVPMAQACGMR